MCESGHPESESSLDTSPYVHLGGAQCTKMHSVALADPDK